MFSKQCSPPALGKESEDTEINSMFTCVLEQMHDKLSSNNSEVQKYIIHPLCRMIYSEIYPYLMFVLVILFSVFIFTLLTFVLFVLSRYELSRNYNECFAHNKPVG